MSIDNREWLKSKPTTLTTLTNETSRFSLLISKQKQTLNTSQAYSQFLKFLRVLVPIFIEVPGFIFDWKKQLSGGKLERMMTKTFKGS